MRSRRRKLFSLTARHLQSTWWPIPMARDYRAVMRFYCRFLSTTVILVPWQQLVERTGVVLRFLPITADGRLDLEKLDRELTSRCRLVTLNHWFNSTRE